MTWHVFKNRFTSKNRDVMVPSYEMFLLSEIFCLMNSSNNTWVPNSNLNTWISEQNKIYDKFIKIKFWVKKLKKPINYLDEAICTFVSFKSIYYTQFKKLMIRVYIILKYNKRIKYIYIL